MPMRNFISIIPLSILFCNVVLATGLLKPFQGRVCEQTLMAIEFSRNPSDGYGLVTNKYSLSVESLVAAYRHGAFPFVTNEDGSVGWYSLLERGVLKFDQLRIGPSDRKAIAKLNESGQYQVTFNQDFSQVIQACANQDRKGQWITPQFIEAYTQLHKAGFAHSVEVWEIQDGQRALVGGMYGVYVDGVFSGESMFHTKSDVVKLAFFELIQKLKSMGLEWMDTQQAIVIEGQPPSSLAVKWGARHVPRSEFLEMLKASQQRSRQGDLPARL